MREAFTMLIVLVFSLCVAAAQQTRPQARPIRISGRYPHLAVFNHGGECGIGAVAPWADRLWLITYVQHAPSGSEDKLYEIDADLNMTARPESVGGTPASRLIHRPSKQLIIGPYFIDEQRNVRVISPKVMPGRLTGVGASLSDPVNKVYIYGMESEFYEVDVHTLQVTKLPNPNLPGYHAKGGYSGQGRFVITHNGERGGDSAQDDAGVLAEWDGREWRVVERHLFCEVTGPGGIYGPSSEADPIWATGWDKRSVILKLRDGGQWHTFRLPIGSYCYTARHGWFTEWPRIREVAPGKLLMNMHGLWYEFPKTFSLANTGGIRPIGCHLKITGDFCGWKDEIVFGCDDASRMENPLVGQAQSNLWFTSWDDLATCGRPAGWGGPWVKDDVQADTPSTPYLLGSFAQRVLHLAHESPYPVVFTLELDRAGNGQWEKYTSLTVPAKGYAFHVFPTDLQAQWIRLRTDRDCMSATAYFHYGPGGGAAEDPDLFASLADADGNVSRSAGIIRPRGEDLGTLHFLASTLATDGTVKSSGYYEIDKDMKLHHRPEDTQQAEWLKKNASVTKLDFAVDEASVILEPRAGVRYRLPKGDAAYDAEWPEGLPRGIREVVTERSLLNACGTLYLLPRAASGGASGIKPICTHNKRITDFCSWRGLLVIAGTKTGTKADGHFVASDDGQVGLWFGDVDDLWKLGKPRGVGGPWKNTPVKAGQPSDPYLMTGYDRKSVELAHDAATTVRFTIQVDFLRDGTWKTYDIIEVPVGQTLVHQFPDGYSAHWVRLTADRDCTATAVFRYE